MSETQRWKFGHAWNGIGTMTTEPDDEYVLFTDHEPIAKRVQELEKALRGTIKVIDNLYPDQFCGDVPSEHENEMKAVFNALTRARVALRK